jgi:hypothetical protein
VLPKWQAEAEEYEADEEDEKAKEEQAFNPHSNNVDLWDEAIEGLVERIFWDRDWMMTSQNPQLLDGMEASLAEMTGLTDYFTNRLPIVTPEQAETAFLAIRDRRLSPS